MLVGMVMETNVLRRNDDVAFSAFCAPGSVCWA